MRLLVLGGTQFVGRQVVLQALRRGYRITLFHRGITRPRLFGDQVTYLYGDRLEDLSALAGQSWDVVLDTSGRQPLAVKNAVEALCDSVGRYVFISTVSVFGSIGVDGASDETPTVDPCDVDWVDDAAKTYPERKVACELLVRQAFGDRSLIVRPGLIVGPYDVTGRYPYWIRAFAYGGSVLVPGPAELHVQLLDVRDLVEFVLDQAEQGASGTCNTVGDRLSFAEIISHTQRAVERITGKAAQPVWVDEDFLLAKEVGPFSDLPLWVSQPLRGFYRIQDQEARRRGLRPRAFSETAQATATWLLSGGEADVVGLSREETLALLDSWNHASA